MLRNQFNKTKLFATAMAASTLVSTGVIVTPITESQQQAVAGGSIGVGSVNIDLNTITDAARNFWRNYYAVNYLQIWYASYPPSSVANIKRQYGSSANSVFHAGCKSVWYSWQRAQPWQKAIIDPFGWFFFVHREEKGVVNCYARTPQFR